MDERVVEIIVAIVDRLVDPKSTSRTVDGLTTQLQEVVQRGEQAIRRDVLVREHGLSERQGKALGHVLEHGSLTIQEYEELCPSVNRRTLQRDLKSMMDKNVLSVRGTSSTDPTKVYELHQGVR